MCVTQHYMTTRSGMPNGPRDERKRHPGVSTHVTIGLLSKMITSRGTVDGFRRIPTTPPLDDDTTEVYKRRQSRLQTTPPPDDSIAEVDLKGTVNVKHVRCVRPKKEWLVADDRVSGARVTGSGDQAS